MTTLAPFKTSLRTAPVERLARMMHVALRSRDLDASIAFYREVFGYRPQDLYESPEAGFRLVKLGSRPWDSTLILYQDLENDKALTHGTAYLYVVVAVRDLDATCAQVLAQGGSVVIDPHGQSPGETAAWGNFGERIINAHAAHGKKLAVVADPDGHPIELVPDPRIAIRMLLRDALPPSLLHLALAAYGGVRSLQRRTTA